MSEEPGGSVTEVPGEDHAQTVLRSLSSNVVVDAVSRIGYLISRFFVPPFILAHITLESYGLWSTSFILVSYIGISTMGVSTVYIKYVAEYAARRNYKDANELVSTGLFLTVPICCAIFCCLWFAWPLLVDWLHIAPHLRGDAKEVIFSVVAIFMTAISLSAFHDVLVGVQKTALTQYIFTIGYIVETILIFSLIGLGRNIRALSEAYVVRTALELCLTMPIAFRVVPWLRVSPFLFGRKALRTLLSFGSIVQLQGLLAIFLDSVERAIASPLLGLSATGLLDISQKLPTMGATVPNAFASAFLPAASYLHGGLDAEDRREAVQKLYLKGSRYMNLTTGYLCAFVACIPVSLFSVWMGKYFQGAAYLMVVFALASQIHQLTAPGTSILKGIGLPYEEFRYGVPNIIALLVTVPLARLVQGRWTVEGIGTAVPLATLLASIYFILHANRLMGVSVGRYTKVVLIPGFIPYFFGLVFTWPVAFAVTHTNRWVGAAWIGLAGFLYTALVAFVVDRFVWDSGERLWFHALVRDKVQLLRSRLAPAKVQHLA